MKRNMWDLLVWIGVVKQSGVFYVGGSDVLPPPLKGRQEQDALDALEDSRPGEYESQYDEELERLYDQILGRPDFSYNLGADPMYQQYRQQYMTQGRLAMEDTMGTTASPSVKARTDTSGPVRNSSMTTVEPDLPNLAFAIISVTASRASWRGWAMMTPLPRARPSALMTVGMGAVSR